MAKQRKPTTSRIRKKQTTVSNANKIHGKKNEVNFDKNIRNKFVELTQLTIDKYNKCDVYSIDPLFKSLQLHGKYIIIRIFKENFIKFKDVSNPNDPQYDYHFKQIDSRMKLTDEPNYIDTPFPYIEKGVIMAISPFIVSEYMKLKEEIAKTDKDAADRIHIPQIGDIVEINSNYTSIWYKDKRYYLDKQAQCLDLVKGPDELILNTFEHYYKFDEYDLSGIYAEGEDGKKGFFKGEEPEWYINELQSFEDQLNAMDDLLVEALEAREQEHSNQ